MHSCFPCDLSIRSKMIFLPRWTGYKSQEE
nr:MAG TPA: hypothetical protein [Caudoviricetes sp.]